MPDSSHRLTSDHRFRSSRAPKLDHLSETTSIGNRYTGAENIIAASMQVTPSVPPFLIALCLSNVDRIWATDGVVELQVSSMSPCIRGATPGAL